MIKHHAHFTYKSKRIPFHFWTHSNIDTPDTVIFLGTGQINHIPRWVAEASPSGVVVVEGLPHWHSHPSAEDIIWFSKEYSRAAFEYILRKFKLQLMHVIGQSQAAPGVLWLARTFPDQVGNIALVLPMGLNVNQLGLTNKERYRELKKRSIRSLLHPEQLSLKNIYAGAVLAKIILAGLKDGSTHRKYSEGVSHSSLPELSFLAKTGKHKISLYIGEHDKLFPAREIEESLRNIDSPTIKVTIIRKKSHTSLTTKASRNMLHLAITALRRS